MCIRDSQPTHPRHATAIQQSTAADALTQTSCSETRISMIVRFSVTPGSKQTRPREGAAPRSPLAELGTAPVMRRGQRRAAVQVGRGATAISWEAEWRSGVAAVFWVYYNKIFSKIRLDITTTTTTTTEEHYMYMVLFLAREGIASKQRKQRHTHTGPRPEIILGSAI